MKVSDRVRLNNPNGYNNYQGTILEIFMWGNTEWVKMKWDLPFHPCKSPIESKHLILVEENL